MRSLRVIKDPNDELYSMVEKDISQEENRTKVLEDLPLGLRDMPDIKLGVNCQILIFNGTKQICF